MELRPLAQTDLRISPICLGTMTFGEQVGQNAAHAILDSALAQGINFIDTAEMYSVPAKADTFGATETIIGQWFAKRPELRRQVVLATKVAGPSRNMGWIRNGATDLKPEHVVQACNDSLRRLQTDVIDLYQIHWPNRNAPSFGALYFDPAHDGNAPSTRTSIHDQLQALASLVKAGKIRYIGLSNETPWGVSEFVRIAEQHGLPKVVSVQNPYALNSRAVDNGLDETLHREGLALLAYSPLAFGTLTGKYDEVGFDSLVHQPGRLAVYESMKVQRWARPEALQASRLYNILARRHGLTPTAMALAFCYHSWRVTSTIIGVTSQAQLSDNVAAWGVTLSPELLAEIDAIRWLHRDPAQ
jgi:aryl-alcohol dehydrogenase-like predicted oxidoreductase